MDEVADKQNKVALVVGKFGIDDWLNGNYIKTLFDIKEEKSGEKGIICTNCTCLANNRKILE